MRSGNHRGGYLLLEDGTRFPGRVIQDSAQALGEAVFNTSHMGYQEMLTDPSYFGQIVVFTAPHIGNTGVNEEDIESSKVQAAGAVVRSLAPHPRNWRSQEDLSSWLIKENAPLLTAADTRAITLHIRSHGAMRAGIFSDRTPIDQALAQVKSSPSMVNTDLATTVSSKTVYAFTESDLPRQWQQFSNTGSGLRVAVLDFGVKRNILRELACRGCAVEILPGSTPADEIIRNAYHGVLLSNGPGDPAAVTCAIENTRRLLDTEIPLFGICLGHQLLAIAAGLETYKLPFGHRGANHPVRCERDKKVEITSQNHGFAVTAQGLGSDWEVTHINLNDNTIEGLAHASKPVFSIQYHPEASPGPHEALPHFDHFIRMMHRQRSSGRRVAQRQ